MKKGIILLASILLSIGIRAQDTINPLGYGLREASDGVARYRVLQQAHKAAAEKDLPISYRGIDTLRLEIPADAEPLPLTHDADFGNAVVMVKNNGKDISLFSRVQYAEEIEISSEELDFENREHIKNALPAMGTGLLILTDEEPWVAERKGYSYPVMRKDVIMLHDRQPLTRPVASYLTEATKVKAYSCIVDDYSKHYHNLTFIRDEKSTFKTFCFHFRNQNNVTVENIHVVTPESKMTGDAVFGVNNCVGITFSDITVEGTYSAPGKYGYAFSMNNVYGSMFLRVKADGKWGVFGTNNMNNTYLEACDINRFDIHCYGRDVYCKLCTFRNKQTQFGSFYGNLTFDSCYFADCIPVRVRASYNAYTPFDITFKDCTFEATRRHHALVNMMLNADEQQRPELKRKCWPNITIDNLTILNRGANTLHIIDPTEATSECRKPVEYLSKINISNITADKKTKLKLSSRDIHTVESFTLKNDISDPHITIQNNINK